MVTISELTIEEVNKALLAIQNELLRIKNSGQNADDTDEITIE